MCRSLRFSRKTKRIGREKYGMTIGKEGVVWINPKDLGGCDEMLHPGDPVFDMVKRNMLERSMKSSWEWKIA